MAGKSFKGYAPLWSQPNSQAKEEEEDNKRAHDKYNKYDKQDKYNNHDNTLNHEEAEPPKRKRGRPRMDEAEKKVHFNLLLRPSTIKALNTIAGQTQAETGERVTVTSLITQLIDEFITDHQ